MIRRKPVVTRPMGIDIGSSTMQAAVLVQGGQTQMVADAWGATEQPALVRWTISGPQVGHYAARFLVTDYECTACEIVRYLYPAEVPPALLAQAPFAITVYSDQAQCNLLYGSSTAGELYGLLVRYLVGLAELGGAVGPIVLTCPASASDGYRVALGAAAMSAGIAVAQIINQPTAALLALMREAPSIGGLAKAGGHVAVVDVGGGSTDVTIARLNKDGVTVLATAGEAHMGGADFGFALAQAVNARFIALGLDLLGEVQAGRRSRLQSVALINACQEAMEQLSEHEQTELLLDHGAGFGHDLWATISRAELVQAITPYLLRLAHRCDEALRGSGLCLSDLDAVALVGGASQIPAVRATIAAAFGKNVGELVCRDKGVVARGAAIQAGIIAGQLKLRVRDVTPYPIGIACWYEHGSPRATYAFSVVIDKNAPIPSPSAGERGAYTKPYYTVYPKQTEMQISVLQYRGRKSISSRDNHPVITPDQCETLGTWTLTGIQPRHESRVNVTFSVDASGILHLHAQENGTANVLTAAIERW